MIKTILKHLKMSSVKCKAESSGDAGENIVFKY